MGAWDIPVFGNDDAADFSEEFDAADTAETVAPVLESAMGTVLNTTDYVEASEGATALVAAALVVAWGHPELTGPPSNEGSNARSIKSCIRCNRVT